MKALRQAAARIIDRARTHDAAGSEVVLTAITSRSLGTRDGRKGPSTTTRARVRVTFADGRLGVADRALRSLDDAPAVVDAAVAAAAPSGDSGGPPLRLDVPSRGLSIADPRAPRLDDDARTEVIESNAEACRGAGPEVGPCEFRYEEALVERAFASTRNTDAVESSTRFRLFGEARAAADPSQVARGEIWSRQFADVASRPLGVELGRRVATFRSPVAIPPTPRPVVLSQEVVAGFLPLLVEAFRAERVDAGRSFMSGRIGTSVAAPVLHLIDDATAPGGLATRAFDDRGVPPVPVPLLREGVAASLYRGPRDAHRLDLRPTGHEAVDGSLWPGNLVVRPGNRSRNMLFPLLGTFVIADELLGGARIDPESGAVRLPVHAFLADAEAVRGYLGPRVLVTDAIALLSSVAYMASDQERHGVVDTASWVLDGPWFEEE